MSFTSFFVSFGSMAIFFVSGNVNYVDAESVSGYALTAVEWISENGIMQGRTDGTFAPADFTTRAEAAAVFERTDKMFG